MIVRKINNDEVCDLPDVVAQKMIDAGKAIQIVEITPTVEELRAVGIEPKESEQPSAD